MVSGAIVTVGDAEAGEADAGDADAGDAEAEVVGFGEALEAGPPNWLTASQAMAAAAAMTTTAAPRTREDRARDMGAPIRGTRNYSVGDSLELQPVAYPALPAQWSDRRRCARLEPQP
jgi:hypothetical protein